MWVRIGDHALLQMDEIQSILGHSEVDLYRVSERTMYTEVHYKNGQEIRVNVPFHEVAEIIERELGLDKLKEEIEMVEDLEERGL